jgi:apolipoprotein N-acyltransferase
MFVCATSGVSQVIDPAGQLHGRLGAMAPGTLVGSLNKESRLTFYTRIGWLTPWAVLGAASGWWLVLLRAPVRRMKPEAA